MENNAPTTVPIRPTHRDKAVIDSLVPVFQKILSGWFGTPAINVHLTASEYLAENSYGRDGYELAKKLERFGYEPDALLVELLDDSTMTIRRLVSEAVKVWVRDNKIVLKHRVGDRVSGPVFVRKHAEDAVIVSVNEELATYVVGSKALGHVPPGTAGSQGYVLDCEDVYEFPITEKTST